ncbi:hypothetical protein [Mesomycoplasma lagogenitalium]|uniref:Uncharacterized protein n=1 Tax=Mesomycoplasma lagogenitalium TaxID=171286 RepID=A0ABY8LXP8_9BACT|nr:hypothetical protein [Mesomycoplasma lagogenitalium]WGI36912.1 hypothetical protein QEG99_01360 [Mesomycoplasma lagogenitalium]
MAAIKKISKKLNYYEKIEKKIEQLFLQCKEDEIKIIVNDELNSPWIPEKYEKKFKAVLEYIDYYQNSYKYFSKFSGRKNWKFKIDLDLETIVDLLIEKNFILNEIGLTALEIIKWNKENVKEVQSVFDNEQIPLSFKKYFFMLLIENEVNSIFSIENGKYMLNPKYHISEALEDELRLSKKFIIDKFYNNPERADIVIEKLEKWFLDRIFEVIDPDELWDNMETLIKREKARIYYEERKWREKSKKLIKK